MLLSMGNTEANERASQRNVPAASSSCTGVGRAAENPRVGRGRRERGKEQSRRKKERGAKERSLTRGALRRAREGAEGAAGSGSERTRKSEGEERRRLVGPSRAEPSEAEEPAGLLFLPRPPPVLPATHTNAPRYRALLCYVSAYTRAHRGPYTQGDTHLDSPYPPRSSVRTTRLRTVYTTVRQGRGSPLRRRARRSPPRARDTALIPAWRLLPSWLVLPRPVLLRGPLREKRCEPVSGRKDTRGIFAGRIEGTPFPPRDASPTSRTFR